MPGRFYVYKFMDGETCLYVGKGTGRRLKAQERRFGRPGEIVRWFVSQKAAFNYEARLIQKLKPTENKVAGGGGAIARRAKFYRRTPEEMEIDRIGTRLYAGRVLLRFDLSKFLSVDEISRLKSSVAELESKNQVAV